MEKIKVWKFPVIQICAALSCALAAILITMAAVLHVKSREIVRFEQTSSQLADVTCKPYITVAVSKSWQEADGSVGAEYDGVLMNNSNHPFTDWSIRLSIPKKSRIDSSWNGQYMKGETIIGILPQKEGFNGIVQPGQKITFGFVMYTPRKFKITNITFAGRFIYSVRTYPGFIIVLTAFIAVCFLTLLLFITETAARRSIAQETILYKKRRDDDAIIIDQALKTLSNFVDAKDKYTKGHSVRVAKYAQEISKRLGFSEQKQREMYYMGLMHDAGKIGIPDSILNKTGKLTPDERKIMQGHTEIGASMLKDFTSMPAIKDIALYHHERFDGTGYPFHLAGINIPLGARIVCVADSFDAMTSTRCYRPKATPEQAEQELLHCSGSQFDPEIVAIMITMINDGFTDSIMKHY